MPRAKGMTALVVATAIAGAVSSAIARADDALVEPLRVRFEGPPDCAGVDAFFREVRARTPHVRMADATETARSVRVTLTRDASGVAGTLVFEDAAHVSAPRSIHGATCGEVVSAFALVTALAVDPHATTDRTPEELPPIAPPDAGVASSDAGERSNANDEDEAPPPRAPFAPPHVPWRFDLGALVDAVGTASPRVVAGEGAFLDLARTSGAPGVVWLFAARVTGEHYGGRSFTVDTSENRFAWWVGQVELCPLEAGGTSWRVRPCASAEIGALTAEASGVTDARSPTRPWFAVGAVAHAEWLFFPPFLLEGHIGARAPVTREGFLLEPSTPVYTPPEVILSGGVALGIQLP